MASTYFEFWMKNKGYNPFWCYVLASKWNLLHLCTFVKDPVRELLDISVLHNDIITDGEWTTDYPHIVYPGCIIYNIQYHLGQFLWSVQHRIRYSSLVEYIELTFFFQLLWVYNPYFNWTASAVTPVQCAYNLTCFLYIVHMFVDACCIFTPPSFTNVDCSAAFKKQGSTGPIWTNNLELCPPTYT